MASYPASVFPADVQTEWDKLVIESREHRQALEAVDQRNSDLAQMYAGNAAAHDASRPQDGGNGNGTPQRQRPGAPAVHIRHDIYDLVAIAQQARNRDELPGLYRDNALRAIEQHRFPGSDRETSQANVAKLLDTIPDDTTGWVARRVLATGSPEYARVFGRALAAVPAGPHNYLDHQRGDQPAAADLPGRADHREGIRPGHQHGRGGVPQGGVRG